MRILMWHVHGNWTTAFLNGLHEVVVPVLPDRAEDGRGLPTTHLWPDTVRELPPEALRDEHFDAVILQRPIEIALVQQWLGRRAGQDLPAVFVEHNSPRSSPAGRDHPLGDQTRIPIVHVTHFNALTWDNGRAPVHVVEHGIPDPGHHYTGMLPRVGYLVDGPVRQGRAAGGDLLGQVACVAPVDVFGIDTAALTTNSHRHEVIGHGDVPRQAMHAMLANRRVYVHLCRWTSPGLSLLEAMYLGMPVIALSVGETPEALVGSAAVVTNDLGRLQEAVLEAIHDPERVADAGRRNRAHVETRYSLPRFHADWDRVLKEVLS